MHCIFILSSNHLYYLIQYPVFIMAMPLNMILILYVMPCTSADEFNKLIILWAYILIHIIISLIYMRNKSVMPVVGYKYLVGDTV